MRPLFADPNTDFVFKKIFGSEEHKPLLIAFLNHLLELDEVHRIASVDHLLREQRPHISEIKHPIVGVTCSDAQGTRYVVEMQVLNVEEFEKGVVCNVANAYTRQFDAGQRYPELDDIIGVTICEFEIWPQGAEPSVPMLSRWLMQGQHGGAAGLGQLQFVFLELPKYDATRPPQTQIDRWAYFFREAGHLKGVPEVLAERPFLDALEAARVARFTVDEWDAYIRAGMAIQDKRGALSLARKQGFAKGFDEGLRIVLRTALMQRGLALDPEQDARIQGCLDRTTLERWLQQALTAATTADALR